MKYIVFAFLLASCGAEPMDVIDEEFDAPETSDETDCSGTFTESLCSTSGTAGVVATYSMCGDLLGVRNMTFAEVTSECVPDAYNPPEEAGDPMNELRDPVDEMILPMEQRGR